MHFFLIYRMFNYCMYLVSCDEIFQQLSVLVPCPWFLVAYNIFKARIFEMCELLLLIS